MKVIEFDEVQTFLFVEKGTIPYMVSQLDNLELHFASLHRDCKLFPMKHKKSVTSRNPPPPN